MSFWSARRSYWARRENSSERGKSQILEQNKKKQKAKKFLKVSFSLMFILLGNLSFFLIYAV